MFDVWVALGFGLLGYYLKRNRWPTAPLILGFMLGPMIEVALRQTVSMGQAVGNIATPFMRPIPGVFMVLAVISIALSFYLRRTRVPKEVWEEDEA